MLAIQSVTFGTWDWF